MPTFRDNAGREWLVEINVAAAKRVRGLKPDFDLVSPDIGATLLALARDPILLVDAIYLLCKPQADERKVSDEDFGRSMSGDSIEKAVDAMTVALTDFTPSPRGRERLRAVLTAVRKSQDRMEDKADAATSEILRRLTQDQVPGTSGSPSTASPVSSVSTPALLPSAS